MKRTSLSNNLNRVAVLALFTVVAFASHLMAEDATDKPAGSKHAPVIFMCGDSTMSDKPLIPPHPERGWGQLMPMYFDPQVKIVNLAVNGRSTKSFLDENRWQPVMDKIQPGDFVIIEFGHNDSKKDARDRFAEPFGLFKQNLERFVRETRGKKGSPILATPVARRSFLADGKTKDTHGDYAIAVRQVAAEQKVPLLDMEKRSRELLEKLGPERSKKLFLWYEPGEFESLPEGKEDSTHFNAYGASRMCDLAAAEMKAAAPELATWLKSKK